MIVFGSSLSPYVRKVLAFAQEKGIEVESRQIGLGSQDLEFRAASPLGKMPALTDGDFSIADSTAIVTYFDALKAEPRLIPEEPRARARTIWWDEFADTELFRVGREIFFNRIVSPLFLRRPGDDAAAAKAQAEGLPPLLDYLESAIPESGWLVEDRLTLADIAVASPFVNLSHAGCMVDADRHPRLCAYVSRMLERPSFAVGVARETRGIEKARAA